MNGAKMPINKQDNMFKDLRKNFPSLIPLRGKVPVESGWQRYCETGEKPSSEFILTALNSNEDGDAWLFSRKLEGKLCFDHAANQWFRWEGNFWVPDKVKHARDGIKTIVHLYATEAKRQLKAEMESFQKGDENTAKKCEELQKALRKRIKALQSVHRKNHVLELSADGDWALGITGEEWDKHPMWLACQNGIVDLSNGELFQGEPHHYIKTASSIEYKRLNHPAPRWEKFLEEIFNQEQELINYVQRLFGYSITGKTTEHIYPIAWGDGRNGKGTLFEILNHVLGMFAGPIEPEMILQQKFGRKSGSPSSDVLFLRGKRLVWGSELSEGQRLDAGKLKWLTGGDTLTGRMPDGKHQVTFSPTHKLFLLTNHKPHASSSDYALWQRILLIPFTQAFVKDPVAENEHLADPDLLEKLKGEASGILAWLVRGCLEWQRNGLMIPDIVKTETEKYRKDEDVISHFIDDICIEGESMMVKSGHLYEEYKKWCRDSGYKEMTKVTFGREMKSRYGSDRLNSGVHYFGLGFRENNTKNEGEGEQL
jgi:putative DNA primase/helicase